VTDDRPIPGLSTLLSRVGGACTLCKSTPVAWHGVCDPCRVRMQAESRRGLIAYARHSIPEGLRGRRLDSDEMRHYASPAALAAVSGLLGRPMPLGLALVGPSGSAKTSLAVGLLTRIHDRACEDGATDAQVEVARGSLFVCAAELAASLAERRWPNEVPDLLRAARGARVLVLDEVQAGGAAVWEVVQRRVNRGLPTIVTTWQTREETARTMGDGFARRVYERTILCERRR
jgi:DNA replication protein DnaC